MANLAQLMQHQCMSGYNRVDSLSLWVADSLCNDAAFQTMLKVRISDLLLQKVHLNATQSRSAYL